MKRILLLLSLAGMGCPSPPDTSIKIAFGSCADQNLEQPLLTVAAGLAPDAFVFLGDNIYGDTRDMDTLQTKYAKLAAKPEFQQLKTKTRLLATWDDHDYGENDAGKYYPYKAASKAIFLDFWEVPKTAERYERPGIYDVEYLEKDGIKVQFILLDTRSFRSNLLLRAPEDSLRGYKNDYLPNPSPDSTFLGAAQWQWLATQLMVPADVRIVASSNQFSHAYNGWESWTNVPRERQKMIDLIRKTQANGVVFISGDVHWGEISKLEVEDGYPLYDVTSSGITETWDVIESNDNRIGNPIPQNNIGLIEIVRTRDTPLQLKLQLVDSTGTPVASHQIPLEVLQVR